MNDKQQKAISAPQPRRWAVPSLTPCGFRVRGLFNAHRTPDQVANRYCRTAKYRQPEQRAIISKLEASIRETRLEKQRHYQAWSNGLRRAWVNFLYSQGTNAKQGGMVRHYMGSPDSSPKYGLWPAIITPRRVQPMEALKHFPLPEIRTNRHPYRPEKRTNSFTRRPEIRTYMSLFGHFLGPKSVHYLEIPSTQGI